MLLAWLFPDKDNGKPVLWTLRLFTQNINLLVPFLQFYWERIFEVTVFEANRKYIISKALSVVFYDTILVEMIPNQILDTIFPFKVPWLFFVKVRQVCSRLNRFYFWTKWHFVRLIVYSNSVIHTGSNLRTTGTTSLLF